MLNIIIFEDNKTYMQKNINSINKALVNTDIEYKIYKFTNYTKELEKIINDKNTKKIYILDVEVEETTGLEIASKIREEDWESIIIFATAYEKYQNDVFYIRLMVLDYICKYKGYEERLTDDISTAVSIINKNKVFIFSYNHIVYRIPYSQICYIEKEPFIKRCIIHTLNNDFYISGSLNSIMEKLEGDFVRTHQSCIANLSNATQIDFASNQIIFKNGLISNLLTNNVKKEVKKYVGTNK